MQQLITSYEADVDQYNEAIDQLEKSDQENFFLKLQIDNLTKSNNRLLNENEQLLEARKKDEDEAKVFSKKAQLVSANAEKHMQMLEQANREKVQAQLKLEDALFTVSSYKEIGTPKKIREKIKVYKERVSKLQAAETQHKLDAKKYRHDVTLAKNEAKELESRLIELDVTEIYSKNGDNLWVFPKVKQFESRGMTNKQVCLWYMNDDGIGAIYSLNEDGEAVRSPSPKGGLKPKKATLDIATTLLRKFKRNKDVVHYDDLKLLRAE